MSSPSLSFQSHDSLQSPLSTVSYETQFTPVTQISSIKEITDALENLNDDMNKSFDSLEGRLKQIEMDLTEVENIDKATQLKLVNLTKPIILSHSTNSTNNSNTPTLLGKRPTEHDVTNNQPVTKVPRPLESFQTFEQTVRSEISNLVNSVAADHAEIIKLPNNMFTTVFFRTDYRKKYPALLNLLVDYLNNSKETKLPFLYYSTVPKFIFRTFFNKSFEYTSTIHKPDTIITGFRCLEKDPNTFIEDPLLSLLVSMLYYDWYSINELNFFEQVRSKVYGSKSLSLVFNDGKIKKEYHGLNIFTLNLVVSHLHRQEFLGFGNLANNELDLLLEPAFTVKEGVKHKFLPLQKGATLLFCNKQARKFPFSLMHLHSFLIPALVEEAQTEIGKVHRMHYNTDDCVSKLKTIRQQTTHMDCPELRLKAPKILEALKLIHSRKLDQGDVLDLETYIKEIKKEPPHISSNILYKKSLEKLSLMSIELPIIVGKLQ